MATFKCSKCNLDKEEIEFYKDNRGSKTHKAECKQCIRERMRTWRSGNKEKVAEYNKKRKILRHNKFENMGQPPQTDLPPTS